MSTRGIEGVYVETTNWGATVAMWERLGFKLEFETDHHSGQLRHPNGGPYVFVAERPDAGTLETHLVLAVDDPAPFDVTFTPQHWGVLEGFLDDPDGRRLSLQAPLPEGVETPAGHG